MGLLKNRWSCLRGLRTQVKELNDFRTLNNWITVCFVLHNIVIQRNDTWYEPPIPPRDFDYWENDPRNIQPLGEHANAFRERMKGIMLGL